jgi:hypothetical protein
MWSGLRDDLLRIHRCVLSGDEPGSRLTEFELMVVALEDRRYFTHFGVDLISVARELFRVLTLQKHGGASTIEMQFVRTVTGYRQHTIRRKLYEVILALLARRRYSKLAILRSYLACAYFGTRLIGASAAARKVFGKEADQLSAREAAFVAAMLARPRPASAPPAWESRVRRRAEYGLLICASMRLGTPGQRDTARPALPAAPIPPPDDARHPVVVADGKAIGPGGAAFARTARGGFMTLGSTPLAAWLAGDPSRQATSASVTRVVQAVSRNEGRLEAINSYDGAFLSFGIFQWSAGSGADTGELAALLDLLRRSDETAFEAYFGRYGLGASLEPAAPDSPRRGFLTLSGVTLNTAEAKQQLRSAAWAYRFWRAGHDDLVRRCQLELAVSRIRLFHGRQAGHRAIADCLTSEYGVALLLDQHVNRPADVLETLGRALARLPGEIASRDASGWTERDELALISLYIEERNDGRMTAAMDRARRILDCVRDGSLSDRRGSFVVPGND